MPGRNSFYAQHHEQKSTLRMFNLHRMTLLITVLQSIAPALAFRNCWPPILGSNSFKSTHHSAPGFKGVLSGSTSCWCTWCQLPYYWS